MMGFGFERAALSMDDSTRAEVFDEIVDESVSFNLKAVIASLESLGWRPQSYTMLSGGEFL